MEREKNSEKESDERSSEPNVVVFQCTKCLSIIGDSMAWISANMNMKTFTLERVTDVVGLKDDIELSRNSLDIGSTFHVAYCKKCNTEIGKQYLASCPSSDVARGYITFMAEYLTSYQVGSSETQYVGPTDKLVDGIQTGMQEKVNTLMLLSVGTGERLSRIEQKIFGKEFRAAEENIDRRSWSQNGRRPTNSEEQHSDNSERLSADNGNFVGTDRNNLERVPVSGWHGQFVESDGGEMFDDDDDDDSDHIESIAEDDDVEGSDITSVSQIAHKQYFQNQPQGINRQQVVARKQSSKEFAKKRTVKVDGRPVVLQKRRKHENDVSHYQSGDGRIVGESWDQQIVQKVKSGHVPGNCSPARNDRPGNGQGASEGSRDRLHPRSHRKFGQNENLLRGRREKTKGSPGQGPEPTAGGKHLSKSVTEGDSRDRKQQNLKRAGKELEEQNGPIRMQHSHEYTRNRRY